MNYRHLDRLSITAAFSGCKKFRYRLDVEKKDDSLKDTVCVIMQNPSVANEEMADKSVQFLEKLIFCNDYTAFKNVRKIIIVNQFAYIQTHQFKGLAEQIGPENDQVIREAIEESDIVLLAWGKRNSFDNRKKSIYKILEDAGEKIVLETKKHPSRGFYKDFLSPYTGTKST